MTEHIRGYLIIDVVEASGKNRDEVFVWDSTAFEGFCKVELRGGARNVKVTSSKRPVNSSSANIEWREKLVVEVLEGSNELRLMLCREKYAGHKKGTSVIAACGIFVNDILEAVPIDKFFDLYKPNGGGEGGQIRIALDFKTDPTEISQIQAANGGFPAIPATPPRGPMAALPENGTEAVEEVAAAEEPAQKKKKKGGLLGFLFKTALLGALAAGGYYGYQEYQRQQDKKRSSSSGSSGGDGVAFTTASITLSCLARK